MGSDMTRNKQAKRAARNRMDQSGEHYAAARRATRTRVREFVYGQCANCMMELADEVEGLFCSELCRQTAETVRYWRRVSRDGRLGQPDVKETLRTRVAHLLAGGYNRPVRRLAKSTRDAIWARDGGRCVVCGHPGEEIDHIDGDSPDLANLQLLCKDCHHAKTATRIVPATSEQMVVIKKLERERVAPDVPLLLCDDEVEWAKGWSSLKMARRREFIDEADAYGIERRDFGTWSAFIEELHSRQDDALGDDVWAFEEDTDYLRRIIARDD